MPFPIHTIETAPQEAKETLAKFVQNFGFLPNIAGAFAESPASLNGLFGLMGAYSAAEMTLSPVERQIVLLAASALNKCEYCTAAHSTIAGSRGVSRTEIENLQGGRPLADAKLESLRRFTEIIVEQRGWASDAELKDFFAAGFTRAQVFEVVFGVALKTLTNYANHIAKPPVNEQFAAFIPEWAGAA